MDEIKLIIDTSGTLKFAAYCLRTDSWQDYRAFLADAKQAQEAGNRRTATRMLRAALLFFFAHMEGVLNHICAEKNIKIPKKKDNLYHRAEEVVAEAKKLDSKIKGPDFELGKHLRNIINHIGVTKEYEDKHGKKETLTQDSVFEKLSVEKMEELEADISPWLDRVCKALSVERFTDTEGKCKRVGELLREMGTSSTQEI